MAKVSFDIDEWYPYYEFRKVKEDSIYGLFVPNEVIERWEKLETEYMKQQQELKSYYEKE